MSTTPRTIINLIRSGLFDDVLSGNEMLNCVTCYACMAKCPRGIPLTEVLLPAVKEQVLLALPELPAEAQEALTNTLRYGNPMGESPRKRAAWAEEAGAPVRILRSDPEPTDVLWIVECYASYYPRGQDNARATAKVLDALGIDFAILGPEEKCAGECVRLLGEAGLFESLREENMAVFEKYQFEQVITSDPHAYDALRHLYPLLGFRHPVEQTTPFVARHIDQLRERLTKSLDVTITYHDSCVLGRHNEIISEPRALLEAIPGVTLVEMAHTGVNTLCCGGGGGGMWLDTFHSSQGHHRLSDLRVKEAVATGADVLAVSCPYEVPRFEDSLKVLGHDDHMVVRDVMELVAEAME
jgi:Fe-S oxidoreductase